MANIIGLGLDATDIGRITGTIERYGDRFLRRIFTDGEIAYCTRRRVPAIHFAGRFAAKEAAMKALGTGHSRGVLWRDCEVVRRGGPPQLQLHGGAARRFAAIGGENSLVPLPHFQSPALAPDPLPPGYRSVFLLKETRTPKKQRSRKPQKKKIKGFFF